MRAAEKQTELITDMSLFDFCLCTRQRTGPISTKQEYALVLTLVKQQDLFFLWGDRTFVVYPPYQFKGHG